MGTARPASPLTPHGEASGALAGGHDYTTVIPQQAGSSLRGRLQAARVQITASVPGPSSGSQPLSWALLLPFVFFFRLWRRLARGAAGQLQGVMGVGRSRAKVFDAERPAILAVRCRGKRRGPGADLTIVARGTPGFSGADLANLASQAAIAAVRDGREMITVADFDAARDRILLEYLYDPLAVRLGGRAAEPTVLGPGEGGAQEVAAQTAQRDGEGP